MKNKKGHIVFILCWCFLFIACKREYKEFTYYPTGKVKEEFIYPSKEERKEKQNYAGNLYYENGVIKATKKIKDGQLNDDYWLFYESGVVHSFMMYKNDTLHGVYKEYTRDGIQTKEALYLNGVRIIDVVLHSYYDGLFCEYYLKTPYSDKYGVYGFLKYDNNKNIIESQSMGCEVFGKDTIYEGELYSLEVINHSQGIKDVESKMNEVWFGEFNEYLTPLDSSAITIIPAANEKVMYSFKPSQQGYNFVMGNVHLYNNNVRHGDYAMWPIYKLFYVKGKDEK